MKPEYRVARWQAVLWILVAGIATVQIVSVARAGNESPEQQDVLRLESRITQLEQRLYAMENNIRTIEQQSRMGSLSSRGGVSPEELNLLRSQLQTFEQRLREDECGIAKLDERTLLPQRRAARARAAAADPDQCRQNVEAPLRLP